MAPLLVLLSCLRFALSSPAAVNNTTSSRSSLWLDELWLDPPSLPRTFSEPTSPESAVLPTSQLTPGSLETPGAPHLQSTLRIVGGRVAATAEFPFIVSLHTSGDPASALKSQFCGGSLVRLDWVLTAGHCCENKNGMYVVAGVLDLTSVTASNIRSVKAIVIHPKYTRTEAVVKNDFCLLALDSAYGSSGTLQTVRMADVGADASLEPGDSAVVAGWGETTGDSNKAVQNFPSKLKMANIQFLDPATALSTLGVASDTTWLYAGGKGQDSCIGDSGGPLTVNGPVLVGVVSWGLACSGVGVYARVSTASAWVNTVLTTRTNLPPATPSTASTIEVNGQVTQTSGCDTTVLLVVGVLALCCCVLLGGIGFALTRGGGGAMRALRSRIGLPSLDDDSDDGPDDENPNLDPTVLQTPTRSSQAPRYPSLKSPIVSPGLAEGDLWNSPPVLRRHHAAQPPLWSPENHPASFWSPYRPHDKLRVYGQR